MQIADRSFLLVLSNYIPLAEEGQNTHRAAMRKMPRLRDTALQAVIACTFPLGRLLGSSFRSSMLSLPPYFLTSLLRLVAN
jgi:hypothetical protein